MKGIMFNTKYGLEQSVLRGDKTRTWRADAKPRYEVGEIVAIKQSYKTLLDNDKEHCREVGITTSYGFVYCHWIEQAGWDNKMFVKNEIMPHQIRIVGIKPCYLQDLTEREALDEGIEKCTKNIFGGNLSSPRYTFLNAKMFSTSAVLSFAYLIEKLNGRGYWYSNPKGYAYEFELVK